MKQKRNSSRTHVRLGTRFWSALLTFTQQNRCASYTSFRSLYRLYQLISNRQIPACCIFLNMATKKTPHNYLSIAMWRKKNFLKKSTPCTGFVILFILRQNPDLLLQAQLLQIRLQHSHLHSLLLQFLHLLLFLPK